MWIVYLKYLIYFLTGCKLKCSSGQFPGSSQYVAKRIRETLPRPKFRSDGPGIPANLKFQAEMFRMIFKNH